MFKKKIGGYIASYGIEDWWLQNFTENERSYMESKYDSSSDFSGGVKLASGKTWSPNLPLSSFLSSLSSWFNTKDNYVLTHKIILKSEKEFIESSRASDNHFYYLYLIRFHYKNREIDNNYELAKFYCKKQIDISQEVKQEMLNDYPSSNLPSHTGYEQLAIAYEKEKEYDLAIGLCEQASEEGWAGDWDKRISRCLKKKGA